MGTFTLSNDFPPMLPFFFFPPSEPAQLWGVASLTRGVGEALNSNDPILLPSLRFDILPSS